MGLSCLYVFFCNSGYHILLEMSLTLQGISRLTRAECQINRSSAIHRYREITWPMITQSRMKMSVDVVVTSNPPLKFWSPGNVTSPNQKPICSLRVTPPACSEHFKFTFTHTFCIKQQWSLHWIT